MRVTNPFLVSFEYTSNLCSASSLVGREHAEIAELLRRGKAQGGSEYFYARNRVNLPQLLYLHRKW